MPTGPETRPTADRPQSSEVPDLPEVEIQAAKRQERFQFRIWQILLVTTLVGLLLGVGRVLPAADRLYWFYIPYFTLISIYLLLRLPMVVGIVVQDYQDRAAIKRKQLEAAETLRERRRKEGKKG